jgi:hypothetical protein
VHPHRSEITVEELDKLFAGEITEFEQWFISRQQARGMSASGLLSVENGILRAFMFYIHGKSHGQNDQAK